MQSDLTFKPRSELKRTLTYRSQVKILNYLFIAFCTLILIYSINGLLHLNSSLIFKVSFSKFFLMSLSIFGLYISRKYISSIIRTTVQINNSQIIIRQKSLVREIDINEINQLKVKINPFLGPLYEFTIQDGTKFKFNSLLERSEYLLEAVVHYKPELADRFQVNEFRKSAILADHSWTRLFDQKIEVVLMIFIGLPVALVSARELIFVFTSHNHENLNLSTRITMADTFLLNLFIVSLMWITREIYLIYSMEQQLQNEFHNVKRNRALESKTTKASIIFQSLALIISFIFLS